MSWAFLFPGQGSQAVGMGEALATAFPAAREVFEEVDEALKQRLSKLIFEGPEDELTLTANAQPALMAVSLAALRALERDLGVALEGKLSLVAGHSLGEYSALTAADSLALEDAARLLRLRGDAMQAAVPVGAGAMAALMGLDFAAVEALCAEAAAAREESEPAQPVVSPANDNGGGQIVISGHAAAVERAVAMAKDKGAKRALLLSVSAPFHCALMQPAAEAMEEALEKTDLRPPRVPVLTNVSAAPVAEPARLRRLLVEQVTGLVRWRESVEGLRDQGIEAVAELGAGKVLTGLVRRIDREIEGHAAGDPESLEALAKRLQS